MVNKEEIINNPDQFIITRQGDFIRIRDSLKTEEPKLAAIRQKLSSSGRFKGKTPEQISKERYDKVWEENNFDIEKLHAWLYDEKNKDKVEIVKLEGQDFSETIEVIFANYIESSKEKKWRIRDQTLVNEETGQIIYFNSQINWIVDKLRGHWKYSRQRPIITEPWEHKTKEKHTSAVIFLHGTYGAGDEHFSRIEPNFPNTKFIYPHSPTLQYDMWHGSRPAPGGQCQGWINITGDAHELMDTDVCPHNPPPKKNFEEADKIIHLDYPQLRRATNYINEIIESEIAAGIPPEKIFISGYSQGGLLTLAVALTSQHKLGGFVSLCGLLPRWDKLLVNPSTKNKETPGLIINNSSDPWVPFWTGKKSYDLLKERGYNVEFKTHPGLGHTWRDKDIAKFLEKNLYQSGKKPSNQNRNTTSNGENTAKKILIGVGIVGGIILVLLVLRWIIKKKKKNELVNCKNWRNFF